MKELMIHVERIVRPLRASQRRKLRMRRELLAHLTAALEEERTCSPDEAGAIAAAKQRLGDPAALARQLEQSVPRVERLMYTRIAFLSRLESLQNKKLRLLMGESNHLEMMGASRAALLMTIGGLVSAAAFAVPALFFYNPQTLALGPDHPVRWPISWLSFIVIWLLWFGTCMRFVSEVAMPAKPWRPGAAVGYCVTLTGLLTLWTFLAAVFFDRSVAFFDVARSGACACVLLFALTLIGRALGSLPRPYEEWLTLDIVE